MAHEIQIEKETPGTYAFKILPYVSKMELFG
jgi:hypothetical protein